MAQRTVEATATLTEGIRLEEWSEMFNLHRQEELRERIRMNQLGEASATATIRNEVARIRSHRAVRKELLNDIAAFSKIRQIPLNLGWRANRTTGNLEKNLRIEGHMIKDHQLIFEGKMIVERNPDNSLKPVWMGHALKPSGESFILSGGFGHYYSLNSRTRFCLGDASDLFDEAVGSCDMPTALSVLEFVARTVPSLNESDGPLPYAPPDFWDLAVECTNCRTVYTLSRNQVCSNCSGKGRIGVFDSALTVEAPVQRTSMTIPPIPSTGEQQAEEDDAEEEDNSWTCQRCNREFNEDNDSFTSPDQENICAGCYNDNVSSCRHCNTEFWNDSDESQSTRNSVFCSEYCLLERARREL